MNRRFTFPEQLCLRTAACILFMLNVGCGTKMADAGYGAQLSAWPADSSHVKHILSCRNNDSVIKYAEADCREKKYYIFWTGTPDVVKFNNYLAAYAKQKYNLILINCGCKNSIGAYYYNNKMDELFAATKLKPLSAIYMEAKIKYNKMLAGYLNNGYAKVQDLDTINF